MSAVAVFVFCVSAETAAAQMPGPIRSIFVSPSDQFEMMSSGVRVFDDGIGTFPRTPMEQQAASQHRVSADELRHPLTEKARRILLKAWNYSVKGDHSNAITTIKEGMAKVDSLIPYGHGFLGIEYVRTGRSKEAVAELKESAQLFPHDAPGHSNLALSLCLTGDFENAEREAKLALYLDPTLASAAEIARVAQEQKARHPQPANLTSNN